MHKQHEAWAGLEQILTLTTTYWLHRPPICWRKSWNSKRQNQDEIWGSYILNIRKVPQTLEEKHCATECEGGNAEVQWNNIKKRVLDPMCDWLGRTGWERQQENKNTMEQTHTQWSRKWMNGGKGRISTTKKVGRTTEDWWTNWKEPKTRPRRNTSTAYEMRSENFKERNIMTWCTRRWKN